jgi:ABC-type bacteriocin/lantibiotic exporter with double-glycine peptidase domain
VSAAQLMLTLSSSAVEFIRGWILLHLGTRINIALISDFLIKLMRLPMGYFAPTPAAFYRLPTIAAFWNGYWNLYGIGFGIRYGKELG